jgi:hypothetical protein
MQLNRRQLLGLGGSTAAALVLATERRPAGASSQAASLPAVTAIPRGDQRIVLISDLNSSYGSTSYIPQVHRGVALVRQLRADLVLCAGDMVAGQKPGFSAAHMDGMWQAFGSPPRWVTTMRPAAATAGAISLPWSGNGRRPSGARAKPVWG